MHRYISISEKMISLAKKCQEKYQDGSEYHFNKFLSEFILLKYFREHNVDYTYHLNLSSEPKLDTILVESNNSKQICLHTLVTTDQKEPFTIKAKTHKKFNFDYYVCITIIDTYLADVVGYCTKKDFEYKTDGKQDPVNYIDPDKLVKPFWLQKMLTKNGKRVNNIIKTLK